MKRALLILILLGVSGCTLFYNSHDIDQHRETDVSGTNKINQIKIQPN